MEEEAAAEAGAVRMFNDDAFGSTSVQIRGIKIITPMARNSAANESVRSNFCGSYRPRLQTSAQTSQCPFPSASLSPHPLRAPPVRAGSLPPASLPAGVFELAGVFATPRVSATGAAFLRSTIFCQNSKIGLAINTDEYVPTIIPTRARTRIRSTPRRRTTTATKR